MSIYERLACCTTSGEIKKLIAESSTIMLSLEKHAEIEKWLITIEAHCSVIAVPDIVTDILDIVGCIKLNVAEIRRELRH